MVQCDKNLGPAIIEKDEYIKLIIRDHLSDSTTYSRLTGTEITLHARRIKLVLQKWLKTHRKSITLNEKRFIEHHLNHNEEPFAAFYATMKVHKSPLKTRPIVSCSGSLLEAIGAKTALFTSSSS